MRLAFLISTIAILTCGITADAAVKTAIVSAESSGTVPTTELLGTGLFADPIDWFNVGSDPVPTLATLENYDSLLVYSDTPFLDRNTLSDRLKDYVDGGGHLVLAAFSFTNIYPGSYDYAIGEAGDTNGILTAGYAPLNPVTHYNTDPIYGDIHVLLAGDPIFNGITIGTDGLLSDFGYFHNNNSSNPILDSGADLLADDRSGVGPKTNMIARNSAGNVVALNLYPSVNTQNSGQFYQLVANALQPVPEPATSIVWVLLGFGFVVGTRLRTHLSRFTQR